MLIFQSPSHLLGRASHIGHKKKHHGFLCHVWQNRGETAKPIKPLICNIGAQPPQTKCSMFGKVMCSLGVFSTSKMVFDHTRWHLSTAAVCTARAPCLALSTRRRVARVAELTRNSERPAPRPLDARAGCGIVWLLEEPIGWHPADHHLQHVISKSNLEANKLHTLEVNDSIKDLSQTKVLHFDQ